MGGWGSGQGQNGRKTTSDYRAIDVRRLQRDKLLAPRLSFTWNWTREGKTVASVQVHVRANSISLNYRHKNRTDDWRPMNYSVPIHWTDCALGGQRAWLRCPALGCGRRVALLYIGSAGIFACRHCYQLAYVSQRENCVDRGLRRADKIRVRLGWRPGVLNGEDDKPKGMHWRTYERLHAKHDAFANRALREFMRRLE